MKADMIKWLNYTLRCKKSKHRGNSLLLCLRFKNTEDQWTKTRNKKTNFLFRELGSGIGIKTKGSTLR